MIKEYVRADVETIKAIQYTDEQSILEMQELIDATHEGILSYNGCKDGIKLYMVQDAYMTHQLLEGDWLVCSKNIIHNARLCVYTNDEFEVLFREKK